MEVIERISDANTRMIVSGRFLPSILGRRIIAKQTIVNRRFDQNISDLFMDNARNPAEPEREIDFLSLSFGYATYPTFKQQFTGANLLDAISDMCQTYGFGYRGYLDSYGGVDIRFYQGVDRTVGNAGGVDPVIFSVEYDNLSAVEYEADYSKLANAVFVAGEGEGYDRKTIWVEPTSPTGIDRFEVFKDSRNISSTTETGTLTDEEYYAQLSESGLDSLTRVLEALAGSVDFTQVEYKTDIDVGDKCTIQYEAWGISMNPRLLEVIESIDESGMHTFTPSFGEL